MRMAQSIDQYPHVQLIFLGPLVEVLLLDKNDDDDDDDDTH